jgi:uncharacterized protein with von Willebrand factor type A (vWA) domain
VTDPVAQLTRFGRALRAEKLPVGTDRIASFCRAAELAPDDLYWAGRATLVARPADLPVYDAVYLRFFGPKTPAFDPPPPAGRVPVDEELELGLASRLELLREKSFADMSPAELAELGGLMQRLRLAVPLRRSRRSRAARAGRPDLRRTIRHSFRTGGDPVERRYRERRRRPRRVVLLLDVSGSMADYSRALLVFAHAALRADRHWEAFCFGTRLTRVTPVLADARPDEALRRAAAEVFDWDGGTRIGESLERFLDEYGHRGMARGAVVVICSDGLEVGDPALVAEQMARLRRLAHRVIWLNPMKEDLAYEPLARGMRAALPHVDVFAGGHNFASLEAAVEAIARA